jgi:hypothetical protein
METRKKRERLFRDTTSGLTATRWPMKKQKATVLKIITVVLLVNEMHIKKQARVRCVITIDYHLLSPLIDQFHIHINRPSSAPIFLIFSWENVYIHHSFFFTSVLKLKKNPKRQSIEGLIIIVYCNIGEVIDEKYILSFFSCFHLVINPSFDK